jgi:hypothetical protein
VTLPESPVEITLGRDTRGMRVGFSLEGSEFLVAESGLRVGAYLTGTFVLWLAVGVELTGKATFRSTIDMRASKGIN